MGSLGRAFSSFRAPGFGALWFSVGFNAQANTIAFVVLSWLALEHTNSPLSVAIVMTALQLPRLFLAYPIGVHSDRADRKSLLLRANAVGAVVMLIMAPLIGQAWFGLYGLILLALLIGTVDAFEVTLANCCVFDVVGLDDAVNGFAHQQLSNRLFGVTGGILGGWLLESISSGAALLAMAASYAISAAFMLGVPRTRPLASAAEQDAPIGSNLIKAIKRISAHRVLALFVGLGLAAEIFAYSSDVLVSGFAREVFRVGETEYGALISLRNAGGIVALLGLSVAARHIRIEAGALAACILFGGALIWFALSPIYNVAVPAMFLIGVAYASVDALLPVSVQKAVANEDRGAASGLLICARGIGPVGQLEIGVLAGALGVAATQLLNASVFLVATLIAIALYLQPHKRAGVEQASDA